MQEDSIRLAILEKNQENAEKEMHALREAISEISKVNVKIGELLAVQQVRIEQQQQKEEDLNKKVESGIAKLTLKMDADRDEIYKKMDTNKTEVLSDIKIMNDKFSEKFNLVYIGFGIALTLQLFFQVAGPQWFQNDKQGGLTNPEPHARIQSR